MGLENNEFKEVNKSICSSCVNDAFLKDWINKNSEEDLFCDYCNKKHPAASLDKLMEEVIIKTFRLYYDNAESNLGWDSEEHWYWGSTYTSDDVVDDFKTDISAKKAVINDIKKSMRDITWCNKDPYRLTQKEVYEYSWKNFSDLVKYSNRFFFLNEKNEHDKETLAPIDILYTIAHEARNLGLIKTLREGTEFYRARVFTKDENRIYCGKNLGSPPKELAKTDRMSACGISAFYASEKLQTACKEIASEALIHKKEPVIGKFKNLNDITYLDLTMINKLELPSVFDSSKHRMLQTILFFRNLNEELTKPIQTLKDIEYIPTQIFAEYFKQEVKIDGIKYPSSKDSTGNCYVLFFNNEQCVEDSQKEIWQDRCELKFLEAFEPKIQKEN